MKRNTTQSSHRQSSIVLNSCVIRWGTILEKLLAKLKQPALFKALHIALKCSDGEFSQISEKLINANRNCDKFDGIRFPPDMSAIYEAYEAHCDDVLERTQGNPGYIPTLSGFVSAIVLAKLWRVVQFLDDCEFQSCSMLMVTDITTICDLAASAERIWNSEKRVQSAAIQMAQKGRDKGKGTPQKSQRITKPFNRLAAKRFSDLMLRQGGILDQSLDNVVMSVCEAEVFPYDYISTYRVLKRSERPRL